MSQEPTLPQETDDNPDNNQAAFDPEIEADNSPEEESPTVRKEFQSPDYEDDDAESDDTDVPFRLPRVEDQAEQTTDSRNDPHRMVTMPIFHEPGQQDPRATLVSSGDKNDDAQQTLQHRAAEPTIAHPVYNPPQREEVEYTAANPNLDHARYQRPQKLPQPVQPGSYVPAPPGAQNARSLPRRQARARRILGLRPGCLYIMLGLILSLCGGLTLFTGVVAAVFIPQLEADWTSKIQAVDDYRAFESTFIYDRYGNQLFEVFGEGRRSSVPFERFPQTLINATIAIEDDTFWTNVGIDLPATTVAFMRFLGAEPDTRTPGGSTITQQLVRNVLFDFEKRAEVSVSRKAEEIILAILLTQRKSKEDILELYLNEIYYGNLAYGAQMAAQTFFGKDVQDLTLGEAALLAGLPQAPADLDPLNPDPAVQDAVYARQRQVLDEMVEENFITQAQRDEALRQGLALNPQATSLRVPHFTVYAQAEVERLMRELNYAPEELARGGFKIWTTVDQNVHTVALGAARTGIENVRNLNASNAAVIVLKPITGEILAMVGSIDYNNDAIDGRVNVTTALRQPGSTMKPFTYSAAMERGMTAGDVIWDTPTGIGIPGQPMYVPVNYDRRFHGPMTMRTALANSYNIPAVQTLRLVGVDYLLGLMRRFGVESLNQDPSQYGLSLTLGGGEVSLLELTNAYAVFANQGSYVEPTSILCIVDRRGVVIYQYENGCPADAGRFTNETVNRQGYGRQAVDPRVAYIMTDILSDNAARSEAMGANSPLRTEGIATAVKTGTTDDIKDNWTVGYTRNVAVGVWVGNNDGDPMSSGASGLTGAAPIWNSVITNIYNSDLISAFRVGGQLLPDKPAAPAGMSLRRICDVRRVTDPSPTCPAQKEEWFLDGPTGIPDADGNLQFPSVPGNSLQQTQTLQEISPDVYRAAVFQIPDPIAAGIQFALQPGDKQPLPPRYCRIPPEQISIAVGGQELVFIALPSTSQSDLVEAERYARQNGLATLPMIDCWPEVYGAAQQVQTGGGIITAVISSPFNGQQVNQDIPIMGTVQFDSSQADYYHLFIQGGQWADWTPLGQPGRSSVINGQLETLSGASIPPGTYRLRLGLIKGSDFVQQPYEITFIRP